MHPRPNARPNQAVDTLGPSCLHHHHQRSDISPRHPWNTSLTGNPNSLSANHRAEEKHNAFLCNVRSPIAYHRPACRRPAGLKQQTQWLSQLDREWVAFVAPCFLRTELLLGRNRRNGRSTQSLLRWGDRGGGFLCRLLMRGREVCNAPDQLSTTISSTLQTT